MASFAFTGDPNMAGRDPTRSCTIGGTVFPKDKPVEVDAAMAGKLRRHSHFAEVGGEAPENPDADDNSIDNMLIADLRALADQRGIDHAGLSKVELRDKLRS